MKAMLGVVALVMAMGCSSAQRPAPAMAEVDRLLNGPVAQEAARDAPEAFAEVTQRAAAARGLQGDRATEAAEDLRLRLEIAHAQAREHRAQRRVTEALQQQREVDDEIQRLDAQARTLEGEISQRRQSQVESQRARVAVQQPSAVVLAERAAMAEEVRQRAGLFLAAAELLGARGATLTAAQESLAAAQRAGEGRDPTGALTAAATAYQRAEAVLHAARTAAPTATTTTGAVDATALTRSLSATEGVTPHRDARGVVAVLRGLFTGSTLGVASRSRVQTLARVLSSQPEGTQVRVEVFVGGAARAQAEATARAQAEALVTALVAAGVPRPRLQAAGLYRVANGSREDDRAEVVLVTPNEP